MSSISPISISPISSPSISLYPNYNLFQRKNEVVSNPSESSTTFHQEAKPIEEVEQHVNEKGEKLEKVYLTNADEALIRFVCQNCFNLTALTVEYESIEKMHDFSCDFSHLASLPKLKEFNVRFSQQQPPKPSTAPLSPIRPWTQYI